MKAYLKTLGIALLLTPISFASEDTHVGNGTDETKLSTLVGEEVSIEKEVPTAGGLPFPFIIAEPLELTKVEARAIEFDLSSIKKEGDSIIVYAFDVNEGCKPDLKNVFVALSKVEEKVEKAEIKLDVTIPKDNINCFDPAGESLVKYDHPIMKIPLKSKNGLPIRLVTQNTTITKLRYLIQKK